MLSHLYKESGNVNNWGVLWEQCKNEGESIEVKPLVAHSTNTNRMDRLKEMETVDCRIQLRQIIGREGRINRSL